MKININDFEPHPDDNVDYSGLTDKVEIPEEIEEYLKKYKERIDEKLMEKFKEEMKKLEG